MAWGEELGWLSGYPFEVRYSVGSRERARRMADLTGEAYGYLSGLFSGVEPDIALVVANRADWRSRQPYGLPFFNDAENQIRPGIVVTCAEQGDFWHAMAEDLREASPGEYPLLLATYPDGAGGVDLQPFFDLVTVHELGHSFQVLGGLELGAFWLGEIFANLVLHAFVATRRPESLKTLEVLSSVGAQSARLTDRLRAEGYSTLEQLEAHYTGGDDPMGPLNYVWYQYRWQRLAAAVFNVDGEEALERLWRCFRDPDQVVTSGLTTTALADILTAQVSETLGRGVADWR